MSKLEKALVRLAGKPGRFHMARISRSDDISRNRTACLFRFRSQVSKSDYRSAIRYSSTASMNILKGYQIRDTIDFLKSEGFLK